MQNLYLKSALFPFLGSTVEVYRSITWTYSSKVPEWMYLWASSQPQWCSWWCFLSRRQPPAPPSRRPRGPEASLREERLLGGWRGRGDGGEGRVLESNWAILLITIHPGREMLIREDFINSPSSWISPCELISSSQHSLLEVISSAQTTQVWLMESLPIITDKTSEKVLLSVVWS